MTLSWRTGQKRMARKFRHDLEIISIMIERLPLMVFSTTFLGHVQLFSHRMFRSVRLSFFLALSLSGALWSLVRQKASNNSIVRKFGEKRKINN